MILHLSTQVFEHSTQKMACRAQGKHGENASRTFSFEMRILDTLRCTNHLPHTSSLSCVPVCHSFNVAHPVWRPHLFQGWATDFIPKLVDKAEKEKAFDETVPVGGFDAICGYKTNTRRSNINKNALLARKQITSPNYRGSLATLRLSHDSSGERNAENVEKANEAGTNVICHTGNFFSPFLSRS